jgi:DNA polymerase-3 subunit alpha
MWLKKRYPLQYYAALLSVETTKIPAIIKEAKAKGIEIIAPDINISDRGFTIDGGAIRIGLVAIKGLGDATTREILSYRPFKSYEDMVRRMPTNKMTKARKEVLLGSGAFDCWGGRDKWVFNEDTSDRISGSWTDDQKAKAEADLLGLVLSKESDIEKYRSLLAERVVEAETLENLEDEEVMVGGEIVSVKEHKTKNGDTMAFVNLEYDHNEYSLTLWPRLYDFYYSMVREGNIILAIGDWQKGRQATVVKQLTTAADLAEDLNGRSQ